MKRLFAVGLVSTVVMAGVVGCSGLTMDTPSSVAATYMEAMSNGDLEQVLKLTSSDLLDGTSGKGLSDHAEELISEVEIGEEIGQEEFPVVAVRYKIGEDAYRGEIPLVAVSLEDKPTYRVLVEPKVLSYSGYSGDLVTVEIDGQSGPVVLPLGKHRVERSFQNQYLEEATCSEVVTLSLGAGGIVESGQETDAVCLDSQLEDRELSEASTIAVRAGLEALIEECSVACGTDRLQASEASELQALPEGCGVEWLESGGGYERPTGILSIGEGGDYECFRFNAVRETEKGAADRVSLARFGQAAVSDAVIVASAVDADVLLVDLPVESCSLLCGEGERWEPNMTMTLKFEGDSFSSGSVRETEWDTWG